MIPFIVLSILYTAFVFVVGDTRGGFNGLNEWGDYLAGFMSPLALAWFVATLILQSKELQLQRSELELQRGEMVASRETLDKQAEHQYQTAIALAETARLAERQNFREDILEVRTYLRSV